MTDGYSNSNNNNEKKILRKVIVWEGRIECADQVEEGPARGGLIHGSKGRDDAPNAVVVRGTHQTGRVVFDLDLLVQLLVGPCCFACK